jgi:hypothetical protein
LGNMERVAIVTAACFSRNKPIGGVTEAIVWRWADETVEGQKPRVAKIVALQVGPTGLDRHCS